MNNARVVTLLEEARTELLWGESLRQGVPGFFDGVVVVELTVRYRSPLVYAATPVSVRLWVSELRGASFTLDYAVSDTEGDGPAVTARTRLVPYQVQARRPRRLSSAEREFLAALDSGAVRDGPGGDPDGGDDAEGGGGA